MSQAYEAIIDEARAAVAAKREPNTEALEARVRALAKRQRTDGDPAVADQAEQAALEQLKRVVSVHRARIRISREPAPPPVVTPPPSLRARLRTQPTITGNMDVSRKRDGETLLLRWDAVPAVAEWEVRFSERADARADYAVTEAVTVPGSTTGVEVPLGDRTMRIHILGKGRNEKIVRRLMISGLTRETWSEKWERRA
ncbi:MAG TPA: hypothetical protein VG652_09185 [Gaiellaceae bacterium]|nr:hypothetical protein [Gaiellaceae bacterium]